MAYVEQEFGFELKLPTRMQVTAERFFERAIVMQHRVLRAVDVAESAAANVALNQIATTCQQCPRSQRWWLGDGRRRLPWLRLLLLLGMLRIALLVIELHEPFAVLPLLWSHAIRCAEMCPREYESGTFMQTRRYEQS